MFDNATDESERKHKHAAGRERCPIAVAVTVTFAQNKNALSNRYDNCVKHRAKCTQLQHTSHTTQWHWPNKFRTVLRSWSSASVVSARRGKLFNSCELLSRSVTCSIIRRLNDGDFVNEACTIGCSFRTKQVFIDGVCFNLDIWDTAGEERFRAVTPSFYRLAMLRSSSGTNLSNRSNADCALLVYDVTNRNSFEKLDFWLESLEKYSNRGDCMKILIGNKLDLLHDGQKAVV